MVSAPDTPVPAALAEARRLDRRRFLVACGAALAAAGTGTWIERRPVPPAAPPAVPPEMVADLAPGAARVVARPDGETLVVRLADGGLAAFDRRCPHLGCPVVWAAARDRFECPCHHAAFDARTGAVLFGPPRAGLAPMPITHPTEGRPS